MLLLQLGARSGFAPENDDADGVAVASVTIGTASPPFSVAPLVLLVLSVSALFGVAFAFLVRMVVGWLVSQ